MSKITVFVSHEDTTVEIKCPGPFSPDVLTDLCHRAGELLREQRMVSTVLTGMDTAEDE